MAKKIYYECGEGGEGIQKYELDGDRNTRYFDKKITVAQLDCKKFIATATNFIQEEVSKRSLKKLAVGLSGGVDSAVTLALAAGSGLSVVAITVQAENFIRRIDTEHAKLVAENLKIAQEIIDCKAICEAIKALRLPKTHHLIMGMRNTIIKELAENRKALLLGTGNKTERCANLFSANSYLGQIFPLAPLFKTQVYQLAKYFGLPACIINKESHSGIEGEKNDTFLGFPYDVFDVAITAEEKGLETTIPKEFLALIGEKKKMANIFFSFPELTI